MNLLIASTSFEIPNQIFFRSFFEGKWQTQRKCIDCVALRDVAIDVMYIAYVVSNFMNVITS